MIDLNFEIRTDVLYLHLKQGIKPSFFVSLPAEGEICITCPPDTDFACLRRQEWLLNVIKDQLRRRARNYLPGRLSQQATQHGFSYSQVRINSARTRWGSCSSAGHINLSLYLMLLPSRLIDYVLLHELCHTREMNHGPRFWQLMSQVTDGQCGELRRELHAFRPSFGTKSP